MINFSLRDSRYSHLIGQTVWHPFRQVGIFLRFYATYIGLNFFCKSVPFIFIMITQYVYSFSISPLIKVLTKLMSRSRGWGAG